MTKKSAVESLDEVLNPVKTDDDKAYDRAYQEKRDAQWLRESALGYARDMHKTNGGMLTAQQIIENAKHFHAYITGESK